LWHRPARTLATGLAILLVLLIAEQAGLPNPARAIEALGRQPTLLAALLIFLVGLAFAAFLWWLASRSFALLRDPHTTPEQMASLRDLPLALPEGTVRAVLALIVGVIGLPLLLFSQALRLPDAIAGYVNGIIAGVFGYYFGAHGSGTDAATARRATEALATQARAHEELRAENTALSQQAASTATQGQVSRVLDSLSRHIGIAETLVEGLGPALPPGLLPAGAADVLAKARDAAAVASKLADGQADASTLSMLQQALGGLIGSSGPFPTLLKAAAAALPVAGGPFGAAALLLGLGWQAGSAAWRRWRAQVLDAPHDPTLFDAGSITPTSAALRLAQAPIFARVFAGQMQQPGFIAGLLDLVLRDDASARLWATYGSSFASPAEAEAGLAEYRRALLGERVAADVSAPAVQAVAGALAAAPPALRPAADEASTRQVLAAAGSGQAPAVQALGLLTGQLRERKLDPLPALRELAP
jgi:hypothetical protein